MFYMGVPSENEMECRFALMDAETGEEALAILRKYAYSNYRLELI